MMSTTVLAVLAAAVMSCALSAAGAAAVISDGCDLLDPSPVLLGYDMVHPAFTSLLCDTEQPQLTYSSPHHR